MDGVPGWLTVELALLAIFLPFFVAYLGFQWKLWSEVVKLREWREAHQRESTEIKDNVSATKDATTRIESYLVNQPNGYRR